MKFKNPETQKQYDRLNSEPLTFESLVSDLNLARTALMSMLSQEDPADKIQFAKDVSGIVTAISKASDTLLKTGEKLKLVVTNKRLEEFKQEWIDTWRDSVVNECGEESFQRIVDSWSPKFLEAS